MSVYSNNPWTASPAQLQDDKIWSLWLKPRDQFLCLVFCLTRKLSFLIVSPWAYVNSELFVLSHGDPAWVTSRGAVSSFSRFKVLLWRRQQSLSTLIPVILLQTFFPLSQVFCRLVGPRLFSHSLDWLLITLADFLWAYSSSNLSFWGERTRASCRIQYGN